MKPISMLYTQTQLAKSNCIIAVMQ